MENVLRNENAPGPVPVAARHRPNREVQVGLFVILGVLAALVALFAGTDPSLLRGRYHLITRVPSVVSGLRRGDAVHMRGVTVGSVGGFKMVPDGVEVELNVERQYEVPADSRIVIQPSSLLGDVSVELVPGKSSESVQSGQTLPGSNAGSPLGNVGQIADQAGQTLGRVQALLSDQTIQNVQTSSAQLAQLLAQLSSLVTEQRRGMEALSQSVRRSAGGIERVAAGPELKQVMNRLDSLTARLDQAAGAIDQSAASAQAILGRAAQGQGSIGKLSRDEALYENMNKAAASINQAAMELGALAQDVRHNPKRYVKLSLF